MPFTDPTILRGFSGLLIGLALGWLILRTNFCAMGAISDAYVFGDRRRLVAWFIAMTTALAGTQLARALGWLDLDPASHIAPRSDWLGSLAGGALFGIGMVLAGGCVSRNAARAGTGDLKALLVLAVVGATAASGVAGALSTLRAHFTGFDVGGAGSLSFEALVPLVLVLLALGVAAKLHRQPYEGLALAGAVAIGALVVLGWLAHALTYDALASTPLRVGSVTYVKPTSDLALFVRSGWLPASAAFGISLLIGTILGGGLATARAGRFRWQWPSAPSDLARHVAGGMLMGVGGVLAGGCTFGQGLTGVSTLAVGAVLSVAAMVAGALVALRALDR
jgi:hypothetical protein